MNEAPLPDAVPSWKGLRRRVLVALLVYNGRSFVPDAVRSVARLQQQGRHDVTVIAFDDASPEPGFSAELGEWCKASGVAHYRTPRNLGIPRNMSLAMGYGIEAGYDHVLILNSDVIVPQNLIDVLVEASQDGDNDGDGDGHGNTIASVTAWSNASSIFSLPHDQHDLLADQHHVDWVSRTLHQTYGGEGFDLPTGMGFCLLVSRRAIEQVGMMDPIFGRGYCEEVDWCRRAAAAGLRNVLALGSFVYHVGNATNRAEGILLKGQHTVHVNEDVIDQRHPDYRDVLECWTSDPAYPRRAREAVGAIVRAAAAAHGASIEVSSLTRPPAREGDVRVRVSPDGTGPLAEALWNGWRHPIEVGDDGTLAAIARFLGCLPDQVRLLARGEHADRLVAEAARAGVSVRSLARYPERV